MPVFHASVTLSVFWPLGKDFRFKILLVEETRSLVSRMKGVKFFGFKILDLLGFVSHW